MAGPMIGPIIDGFPVSAERLYFEPNGEFPGHEPNPLLPENRKLIIDTVLEKGAELGIAWDGDGDRCFFVDDHGEFVPGDFMTALLAQAILAKEPGATILYDVRASRAVKDTVEAAGGKALVNRVGHAFFKTRMRETGAVFGGEVSGHYYFRNFWCADSGVIPALLVLELLSVQAEEDVRAAGALPEQVLHLGRDQLRGIGPGREDARARGALLGLRRELARRRLGRLRLVALQRAPVQHRAAATAQPRGLLAGGDGGPHRGDPQHHPVVNETSSGAAALARAAEAGIHVLRIPTPFAVGRVNAYLIEDDPLTLVDSGPNSGRALDELHHQLAEHGHSIDDIELIVLTHQHMDHLGLVDIIASHSGAEVAALDKLSGFVEDFSAAAARDDEFATAVMLRNGISEDVVQALRQVSSAFRAWGGKANVTRPLSDGEVLSSATESCACCTGRGTAPRTPCSGTSIARS